MNFIAKTEMEKILENLRGENFFNLSGKPIDPRVMESLKLGKKYTPFQSINFNKELRKFDGEIISILNNIFGKAAKQFKTQNLFIKLRKLKKTSLIKNNKEMSDLVQSIEKDVKLKNRISLI